MLLVAAAALLLALCQPAAAHQPGVMAMELDLNACVGQQCAAAAASFITRAAFPPAGLHHTPARLRLTASCAGLRFKAKYASDGAKPNDNPLADPAHEKYDPFFLPMPTLNTDKATGEPALLTFTPNLTPI